MYQRVEWMKAADQSILQVLGPPQRHEMTTSNVARNAGLSREYTSNRLQVLVEHGLVKVDKEEGTSPFYSIADLGEDVLKGHIDPTELEAE